MRDGVFDSLGEIKLDGDRRKILSVVEVEGEDGSEDFVITAIASDSTAFIVLRRVEGDGVMGESNIVESGGLVINFSDFDVAF